MGRCVHGSHGAGLHETLPWQSACSCLQVVYLTYRVWTSPLDVGATVLLRLVLAVSQAISCICSGGAGVPEASVQPYACASCMKAEWASGTRRLRAVQHPLTTSSSSPPATRANAGQVPEGLAAHMLCTHAPAAVARGSLCPWYPYRSGAVPETGSTDLRVMAGQAVAFQEGGFTCTLCEASGPVFMRVARDVVTRALAIGAALYWSSVARMYAMHTIHKCCVHQDTVCL